VLTSLEVALDGTSGPGTPRCVATSLKFRATWSMSIRASADPHRCRSGNLAPRLRVPPFWKSPVPSVFVSQLTAISAVSLKQSPNIDEDDVNHRPRWDRTASAP